MFSFLEEINPPQKIDKKPTHKRILCIIEGDLEFRYIVKIFKLFGYKGSCYSLSNELITIAWGNSTSKDQNIVQPNCKFQGGSLKGRKVPFPAIDAFTLYNRDLSIFDSVIVFFDGDKDKDNEVENYFKEQFKNLEIKNTLLVSMPCFESSLIDFCCCGSCREDIDNKEDGKYPCDKYKKSFSSLDCFKGAKDLIVNLNQEKIDILQEKGSILSQANSLIKTFMSKKI